MEAIAVGRMEPVVQGHVSERWWAQGVDFMEPPRRDVEHLSRAESYLERWAATNRISVQREQPLELRFRQGGVHSAEVKRSGARRRVFRLAALRAFGGI